MNLKKLNAFCKKYQVNTEYVTFAYGHKEVMACFNRGALDGFLYPEDEGFDSWYSSLEHPMLEDVYFSSNYDTFVLNI